MRSRVAIVAAFLAGLGAATAAFAQHEGHQMLAAPAGMGACAEHSRASLEIIDRAQRRLEESRQTNSPARMRSAMDDLQRALAELRTHQSLCVSAAAAEAKPTAGPMPGPSPGMETMDHSKMPGMPGMPPPQAKTKDPICFKDVDSKGAEKATYQGKTYYFCSRADREKFLSDPAPYVKR